MTLLMGIQLDDVLKMISIRDYICTKTRINSVLYVDSFLDHHVVHIFKFLSTEIYRTITFNIVSSHSSIVMYKYVFLDQPGKSFFVKEFQGFVPVIFHTFINKLCGLVQKSRNLPELSIFDTIFAKIKF